MGQEKGSSTEVKENGIEFAGEKCKTGQKRGFLEFIGELFINHSFLLITIKAWEGFNGQNIFFICNIYQCLICLPIAHLHTHRAC